jgi:hypothetical protein
LSFEPIIYIAIGRERKTAGIRDSDPNLPFRLEMEPCRALEPADSVKQQDASESTNAQRSEPAHGGIGRHGGGRRQRIVDGFAWPDGLIVFQSSTK